MKSKLIYQEGSDTIRQMPENYCIAYRRFNAWVCEPDLAADVKLSNQVFNLLFDYDFKHGSGEMIVNKINN